MARLWQPWVDAASTHGRSRRRSSQMTARYCWLGMLQGGQCRLLEGTASSARMYGWWHVWLCNSGPTFKRARITKC